MEQYAGLLRSHTYPMLGYSAIILESVLDSYDEMPAAAHVTTTNVDEGATTAKKAAVGL